MQRHSGQQRQRQPLQSRSRWALRGTRSRRASRGASRWPPSSAWTTSRRRCCLARCVDASGVLPRVRFCLLFDRAHQQLLRLAKIVSDTATTAIPHIISIREVDEDLLCEVDGSIRNLTAQQRETLVAFAILLKNSKLSAQEFNKLIGFSDNAEQNVINRCKSLIKSGLSSLGYQFKNGICALRGIRFETIPTEKRLRDEF